MSNYSQFEKRKQDHIELALMPSNQANEKKPLEKIMLIHEALPNLDFHEINIASICLSAPVTTPFFVASMTAGHQEAFNINYRLMEACSQTHWSMGVGSQRRELTDPKAALEWRDLRRTFPGVSLLSNIGIAQLIVSSIEQIQKLTEVLEARALIIHCNPLQECIQPEGTPEFKGCWDAIEQLVKKLPIPIVVKETGCGFSVATLSRLNNMGVAAVDVSGLGGTHWGRIEGYRALQAPIRQQTAITFRHWGIDTVQSIINAQSVKPHFEIWGSGGVRHGLDAAKLLALGACMVGLAKPMLEAALTSVEQVVMSMNTLEYELKTAMFCTGSRSLQDLKEKYVNT